MHFLVVGSLITSVAAVTLPASSSPDPFAIDTNVTLATRGAAERNQCGDSLFIDKTSAGSPDLYDSAWIVYDLRSNKPRQDYVGVTLPLTTEPWLKFYSYRTCAFGLRNAYHGNRRGNINIGVGDVADPIDSSIQRYGRDNKVGAEGAMVCNPFNDGAAWAVYHT